MSDDVRELVARLRAEAEEHARVGYDDLGVFLHDAADALVSLNAEEVREYVGRAEIEYKPWEAPTPADAEVEKRRLAGFDRWLAEHDRELREAILDDLAAGVPDDVRDWIEDYRLHPDSDPSPADAEKEARS